MTQHSSFTHRPTDLPSIAQNWRTPFGGTARMLNRTVTDLPVTREPGNPLLTTASGTAPSTLICRPYSSVCAIDLAQALEVDSSLLREPHGHSQHQHARVGS